MPYDFTVTPLYAIGGYLTFSVHVVSGEFSGKSNFCVSCDSLQSTIAELEVLYATLSGQCVLYDGDSDDYLVFTALKHGHIQVQGQLGGSYNDQFLKFLCVIDQTSIKSVIVSFQRGLKTQG